MNLRGQRFGRLVGIAPSSVNSRGGWLFQCDCGEKVVKSAYYVKSGRTQSCGCLRNEVKKRGASLTHGHTAKRLVSPTYSAWQNMKKRCYDPNCERFPHYGGRGIGMTRAWYSSFEAFLKDMGEAPPGTSIDRVKLEGHYEPANCRWATPMQQARNTSECVWFRIDGRIINLSETAELLGVPYKPFWYRVRKVGMDPIDAAKLLLTA